MTSNPLFRIVIILVIAFETCWFVAPRNSMRPSSPRTQEAARASVEHPSRKAQLALQEQIHQDVVYNDRRHFTVFISLLIVNAVLIHFFWNERPKTRTA